MENNRPLQTIEKALRINLDPLTYGTLAEIGAGQEVARNFFQAGAAAGTVAKTMSAYDMQVSDAIYGEEANHRYVSQTRVQKMVDREYGLLVQRLQDVRPVGTRFFAFADTAVAKGYHTTKDCHCWLGIKFQLNPGGEPNTILMHVRMKDNSNSDQQEALGVVGVNLIYGAYYDFNIPEALIESLLDNLGSERMEVDMIKFEGPDLSHIDNRLMALHLVKVGHTPSVFFTNNGDPIQALDLLYKKNILLFRGSFRPFTNVHMDIFDKGKEYFEKHSGCITCESVYVTEMSMAHLLNEGNLDKEDFLGRVNILCKLGFNVQISNRVKLFELKDYIRQFTYRKVVFLLGVRKLETLFQEEFFTELKGGLLEGLAIIFSGDTNLYVYPKLNRKKELVTLDKMNVSEKAKHLFIHFHYNKKLIALKGYDADKMIFTRKMIAEGITKGDGDWKNRVPEIVYNEIVANNLFGFPGK